jgi:uncharacterized protein (TIGR02996 family)
VSDRLPLLRAILANPDDDVSRLVFGDWLDEHGTTDADAARVEFIRLGCKMKSGKRPISANETRWLVDNWKRLLPNTLALAEPPRPPSVRWKGRFLPFFLNWMNGDRLMYSWVQLEFARGAVRAVGFKDRPGYDRFWRAVAADDPLAVLGPTDLPRAAEREMRWAAVPVYPEDWGEDVFARLAGFDEELPGRWKRFITRPHADRAAPELWDPRHRVRQAVSDAMTAIAREANGLTPNPAGPA